MKEEENVHEQFQKLMTHLNKSSDAYELKAANSIYGAKEFQFLQVSGIPGPKYLNDHSWK